MLGGKNFLGGVFGPSPIDVIRQTRISKKGKEPSRSATFARKLTKNGYKTETEYKDKNGGKSDGRIRTWQGSLFHEVKDYLDTRSVLNDLIGKMRRYMRSGNYVGGIITINYDAREDLLEELKQEVRECNFNIITGDIKVIVRRNIVQRKK